VTARASCTSRALLACRSRVRAALRASMPCGAHGAGARRRGQRQGATPAGWRASKAGRGQGGMPVRCACVRGHGASGRARAADSDLTGGQASKRAPDWTRTTSLAWLSRCWSPRSWRSLVVSSSWRARAWLVADSACRARGGRKGWVGARAGRARCHDEDARAGGGGGRGARALGAGRGGAPGAGRGAGGCARRGVGGGGWALAAPPQPAA
jgi:hypothetical protein